MEYLESTSNNPRWNLALEQYVFDCMDHTKEYFILWQNSNTIVVGKNQNTIQEINNDYVRSHNISVVRRLSGGGAVYHDLGNLNFTYIVDAGNMKKLNFRMFCQPIVEVLKSFGVEAEISGRNDITIDGKKFSGNSQYIRDGRVMHHGTILFNSNLDIVEQALNVDKSKIESKGVTSVRSHVTNLSEYLKSNITLEVFKKRLLDYLMVEHCLEKYTLSQKDLDAIEIIKRNRYDTWEWNYGRSPSYTNHKICHVDGCGQIEIYLYVEKGNISNIQFFGDFFGSGNVDEISKMLKGCPCCRNSIEKVLGGCNVNWYIHNVSSKKLAELIVP